MDENNHLFCGHGEQMFTVILCSVEKKKKHQLSSQAQKMKKKMITQKLELR